MAPDPDHPSKASWQNHAFIRSVPNRGIKYVRIHNLLNLITVPAAAAAAPHPLPGSAYNFTLLDAVLDMVAQEHGLLIGFEVMGNPRRGDETSRDGVYTSWREESQLRGWRVMVATVVRRYLDRYGSEVRTRHKPCHWL